jgi:uncharacterized Zn finger protein (UPF0148 family)
MIFMMADVCPTCGTQTVRQSVGELVVMYCPQCQRQVWPPTRRPHGQRKKGEK